MTEQTLLILRDAVDRFNAGDPDTLNDVFAAAGRRARPCASS
jgi:hypothetical protein